MSCCITRAVSVSSDPFVPDGCGILKEELDRIDANFGTVLEARVAALYDQCTGGGAGL